MPERSALFKSLTSPEAIIGFQHNDVAFHVKFTGGYATVHDITKIAIMKKDKRYGVLYTETDKVEEAPQSYPPTVFQEIVSILSKPSKEAIIEAQVILRREHGKMNSVEIRQAQELLEVVRKQVEGKHSEEKAAKAKTESTKQ